MSHNVKFFTYQETVDKKRAETDLSAFVAHEDWQEGCSGLPNPIRWLDIIADSEEKAGQLIAERDRGNYDCLAVKFRETPRDYMKTKKYIAWVDKQKRAYSRYRDEETKIRLSGQKSAYVSCKKCGSFLNRAVLIQKFGQRANYCPLCGADFRSPTVLKTIENAKERYDKVCADLKEAEKKAARNSKIRWLVKIEYHT